MHELNKVPENITKMSSGSFLQAISKNTIVKTEVRQPLNWIGKPYGVIDIKLFEFPDKSGVILAPAYLSGRIEYYYYRYGCNHEYIMTKKEGAYIEFKCKKCSHIKMTDSSD
jgi:hypothetical protein